MQVLQDIPEARRATQALRPTVLVPTMGALHEGHLSLIRRAHQLDRGPVAVSIFVNPTQFAPNEDLNRYPRPLEKDLELCRNENVALVFNPSPQSIYPADEPDLLIDIPSLTQTLEGAHRPNHFAGVARIVTKLFNILTPAAATFGQKDFQQLLIIQTLTRSLNLPVDIIPCPTIREQDGLALSSRNAYLSPTDRPRAAAIHQALQLAAQLIQQGQTDTATIEQTMHNHLTQAGLTPDYTALRNPKNLQPINKIDPHQPLIALIAAHMGNVRLIDNLPITPPE